MTTEKLFGGSEEENKPKKPSQDKMWDFLSLFYKSARIGDARMAVICAEIIRQTIGEMRVVLTLNQLVGEDLHPVYYHKMFPIVAGWTQVLTNKIQKGHNLWQSVYMLAKCPKWYMDNIVTDLKDESIWSGLELEDIRQEINCKLELHVPEKLAEYVENFKFPTWTYDRHTRKGQALKRQNKADLRLDGGWDNRYDVKRFWDQTCKNRKILTSSLLSYNETLKLYISKFYA